MSVIAGWESYSRIVATLIRVTGDWNLAEDCAQEAMLAAVERWPTEGEPANPGGWLLTVARNRAIDVLRRAAVENRKLKEVAMLWDPSAGPDQEIEDDRLRLVFTCCHPALSLEARVALTLRTVAGVPTADIARAFLVTESAMTRRLTRAKSKIADAAIPYRVPTGPALAERLTGVLAVLYLLFTRGYDPDGEPAFAEEAIRLTRLLTSLMPGEPEVDSLLALFLLQHSRRDARRDAAGDLVTLDRQDRTRWDRRAIAEALAVLARIPVSGPYGIQARIAACHATARSADSTDWRSIAGWYDELARVQPSPVVALNRAVALAEQMGPERGLAALRSIPGAERLAAYPFYPAALGELELRSDHVVEARKQFRAAHRLARNPAERTFLERRLAECERRLTSGATSSLPSPPRPR